MSFSIPTFIFMREPFTEGRTYANTLRGLRALGGEAPKTPKCQRHKGSRG